MDDKNPELPAELPVVSYKKPVPKPEPEATITAASFVGMYGLPDSEGRIVVRRHSHELKTEADWYEMLKSDFTMCRNLKS